MFGLDEISFAAPWALAGLAVLPLLWWLLRVTPPAPWRLRFPPIRFLLDLVTQEDSAARTPWWLLILRLVLAALVIVAAAQPLKNAAGVLTGAGPVVIIVDDGWASARDWPARRTYLANLVDEVERAGRTVAIVTTAPSAAGTDRPPPQLMTPSSVSPMASSRPIGPATWSGSATASPRVTSGPCWRRCVGSAPFPSFAIGTGERRWFCGRPAASART